MTNEIEFLKSQNIRPIKLPHREQYYEDLFNIEYSWTGRADILSFANTFIKEAEQELINSMTLFEMGYFDCAYYALRSAVEISLTLVYLSDMPDDQREERLADWKETRDFPMQGQMIKQLSQLKNVFADMEKKMPKFFENAKGLSAKLNKFVHKQGFQHFYVVRNNPINKPKSQDIFINNYEYFLKESIGVVAIMRLAIDPFPILLMDEEILCRCFDTLTEPYQEDFVQKYIGTDMVNAYKQTELYVQTYNYFIQKEKKTPAVFDVMKNQYIDSRKMDEIFKQLHLLRRDDIVSVLLVKASEKIVKVYCDDGLWYWTNRKTNREKTSWSSQDFQNFLNAENKLNQPYDEAYISVLIFNGNPYYIEHNELISQEEVNNIYTFVGKELLELGCQ